MKLTDVLTDANKTDSYPVIITDGDFNLAYCNGAAKEIFFGIEGGRPLDEYAEIFNSRELKRSRYPSTALLRVGSVRFPCAFCPVITGFDKEYVFTVAPPLQKEKDDGEYYLSVRTAVLLKCLGDAGGEELTAGAKRTYAKLYAKYETNMRMMTVISGNAVYAAVDVEEFFSDILSYYCSLKYADDNRKRYDVITDGDIMRLSNVLCVVIVGIYDICMKLSQNGYCSVSFSEDDEMTRVRFDFKPKNRLISAMARSDDAEDAVYRVLGRGADDISLIKALSGRIRGDISIKYGDSVETMTLTVPREKGAYLSANSYNLAAAARIAAERAAMG